MGSDVTDVQQLQETYTHLAVIDSVTYSYKGVDMMFRQGVFRAIRHFEHFSAAEKHSSVAVNLPIRGLKRSIIIEFSFNLNVL